MNNVSQKVKDFVDYTCRFSYNEMDIFILKEGYKDAKQ